MLFLRIISVSCLLAHIQQGQAAVVDTPDNGIGASLHQVLLNVKVYVKACFGRAPDTDNLLPTSPISTTTVATPTSPISPRPVPFDCSDVFNQGFTESGVYTIKPTNWPGHPFEVYCNMTQGGGWTVFQRRVDGSLNFTLGWNSYKEGFGPRDLEHWLGNEKLHYLTNQDDYQLLVDLVDRDGTPYYLQYDLFRISNESDNYRLDLGSYLKNGAIGHDFFNWHKDNQFSTYDRDNDGWGEYNCAQRHLGGWWYGRGIAGIFDTNLCSRSTYESYCNLWPLGDNCGWCSYVNLNGDYNSVTRGTNIFWNSLVGWDCNLVYTEMKIRPI